MNKKKQVTEICTAIDPAELAELAEAAGLQYVNDQMPGIGRESSGNVIKYRKPDGGLINDPKELQRIKALAIPPAWTDVWICPNKNGHIQATGRDAKRRKQYRYHARWRKVSDETKYNKMVAFGQALPNIRKRVSQDLSLSGLSKEKVLAAIVRLLEITLIRVGNEEYARQNKSFGLTTLRDRHVDVDRAKIKFKFKGKSGQNHSIALNDPRLAKVVRRCKDLPGQELFQYMDEKGQTISISSTDVNEYLHAITDDNFTAKDFRTWAGTVLAVLALQEFQQFDSDAQAKRNIVKAIEAVAKRLGNTPSVCRKCYIHPEVLNAYLEGELLKIIKQRAEQELVESLTELNSEEAAVLAFLQQRLKIEIKSTSKK